ncbi:hypothetical protein D3C87_2033230 [compost metagenome]
MLCLLRETLSIFSDQNSGLVSEYINLEDSDNDNLKPLKVGNASIHVGIYGFWSFPLGYNVGL